MRTIRKFWSRVFNGRWKVVNLSTGVVLASHWSREKAMDQSSEMNAYAAWDGRPGVYGTRWM